MINISQLISLVIEPTLKELNMHSASAVNLLAGTALVESDLTYLKQRYNGPALGIYQLEPLTHSDLWGYLSRKPELSGLVRGMAGYKYHGTNVPPEEVIHNLGYATAMARIHYWRIPSKLPEPDDLNGLASYWKRHYNTMKGAGHIFDYVDKFRRLA